MATDAIERGLSRGTPGAARQGLRGTDILRFHAPVAATIVSYSIVFNILNSAMARTPMAASALAAFAVAQSLVDLLAAPSGMGNQWILARGRDRASLRVGARVIAQVVAIVTATIAAVGWTPLGRWIYIDLFSAPAGLYSSINGVIRVCVLMPAIWAVRNAGQSILMLKRQTHLMTAGVMVRLAWVLFASTMLLRVAGLDGAVLGGLLWISGIAVEATFLILAARRHLPTLPAEPVDGNLVPTPPKIWGFLLPLMGTAFLWTLGRPLMNAAMARTADPETSIATFQVAWHAASLLLSLQSDFRQIVVVFWTDEGSLKALTRFALTLGGIIAVLMVALGLTGGATWFLQSVLGAPAHLTKLAGTLFVIVAVLPVLTILTEVYIGRLLRNGTTRVMMVAKAINMAVMVAIMFGLAGVFPSLGPLVGVIGMVAGHGAELAAIRHANRNLAPVPAVDG